VLSLGILISSCASIDENAIELTWKKKQNHQHLGSGFWISVPHEFYKADSYRGFQAPNYSASMALKESYSTLEKLNSEYANGNYNARKIILSERKPVLLEGDTIGLFLKLKYRGDDKSVLRLFLKYEDVMYQLETFYFDKFESKYEENVKHSIFSIVKAEEQKNEQELQVAQISDDFNIILTRDGAYPTEAEDGFTVEQRSIGFKRRDEIHDLLEKMLKEKLGIEINKTISVRSLSDGRIYSIKGESDNLKTLIKYIAKNDVEEGTLIVASGNEKSDLKKMNKLITKSLITIQQER